RFRNVWRLLGLAAALIVLGLTPWELKVSGPFRILAERELTVVPQVDGQISAIHVEDGSRVRRGQRIAALANPDVRRNAAKSQAVEQKLLEEARGAVAVMLEAKSREAELRQKELLVAQSRLDLAMVGPRREEVEAAEAEVRRLGTESGFLQDELRRATVLSPA